MKKFLLRLAVIVAVLLPFMDTPNRKAVSLVPRPIDAETIIALNRPMPWETNR
jgi:hypothetical protein